MQDKVQIGLIAWGTKLGKQIFFSSPHLNIEEDAISVALEDIRAVINFTQTGLKFFSLEFTEQYRIYTGYRTIIDWVSREGYLAISVLIPHSYILDDAECHKLLLELMATYEHNYIDERQRIRNQRENPELFFSKINNLKPQFNNQPKYLTSAKNKKYAVINYNTNDISTFLDTPYRSEYGEYKEVFFIAASETRLRPSENAMILDIEAVVINYSLDFEIKDESGAKLKPDNIAITIGQGKPYRTFDSSIKDLKHGDIVDVSIEKTGYISVKEVIDVKNWEETSKTLPIILRKKPIEIQVYITDEKKIPLKGVDLTCTINKKTPAVTPLESYSFFHAYIGDHIEVVAEKDYYRKERESFEIRPMIIKNDICSVHLELHTHTSPAKTDEGKKVTQTTYYPEPVKVHPKPFDEPPKQESIWIKYRYLYPSVLFFGILGLIVLVFAIYRSCIETIPPSTPIGGSSIKTRLTNDKRDLQKDIKLDTLKQWQVDYSKIPTNQLTDKETQTLYSENKGKIDTLVNKIEKVTAEFNKIDSLIKNYQFYQPDTALTKSLKYLKELDDNPEYREKKNVLIKLLEKYIEIRRNVYVWQHPNTNKLEIRKKSLKYIHDIIKLDKSITPAQLAFLKSIG